jgi:hypothetical protein
MVTRGELKQMEERLNQKMDAQFLQLEQRMTIKLDRLRLLQ